jgi:hypothetical protein
MVRQWEAWAHRTGVLPWIWKPAYGEPDDSAGSGRPARTKKKAPKR